MEWIMKPTDLQRSFKKTLKKSERERDCSSKSSQSSKTKALCNSPQTQLTPSRSWPRAHIVGWQKWVQISREERNCAFAAGLKEAQPEVGSESSSIWTMSAQFSSRFKSSFSDACNQDTRKEKHMYWALAWWYRFCLYAVAVVHMKGIRRQSFLSSAIQQWLQWSTLQKSSLPLTYQSSYA